MVINLETKGRKARRSATETSRSSRERVWEETTFKLRAGGYEGFGHVKTRGTSIPRRGNSTHKGLGTESVLMCSRNSDVNE